MLLKIISIVNLENQPNSIIVTKLSTVMSNDDGEEEVEIDSTFVYFENVSLTNDQLMIRINSDISVYIANLGKTFSTKSPTSATPTNATTTNATSTMNTDNIFVSNYKSFEILSDFDYSKESM